MRFLVTAGNTRERIDDVRDWGNIFTGNTGYRIARAIARAGEVDLVSSNLNHLAELRAQIATSHPIHGHAFTSHEDLRSLLASMMAKHAYDAVFMSAAVADYRPVRVFAVASREPTGKSGQEQWIVRDVQAGKIKSTHGRIAILGEPTEKIVDLFRGAWNYRGLLVKFKLEVGLDRNELIRVAEASRRASGADYLVANTLDMVQGPSAGAFLLSDAGADWVPRGELPQRMLALVTR
jgi:phosphopantothenoylcysteine synthetase/decarboxylase